MNVGVSDMDQQLGVCVYFVGVVSTTKPRVVGVCLGLATVNSRITAQANTVIEFSNTKIAISSLLEVCFEEESWVTIP